QPALQSVTLAALLVPALVAYSRFRVDGLVIAFLVCQSLVHLMKRAIFLFGPQTQAVYFGVQLLPTVILVMLIVVVVRESRGMRLPASGRLLGAYVALAAVTTLVSLGRRPWMDVMASIHQQLLPFTLFYAGLLLTPGKFARVGRTMAILAAVSVLYGFLQLVGGPTAVDRAWAHETYSYSLHGSKVFAYLGGGTSDFRSYSYYADPLTWGFFLLAGMLGATVARLLGRMSRVLVAGVILLSLSGLFFSLTRTVWAGLAAMLGAFWLLRYRSLRRPWQVFALVLGSFAAAVMMGDLLYRELFLAQRMPVVQSQIAARYLTVGTIEARTSAWNSLREVTAANPLWGNGYAVMYSANRSGAAAKQRGVPFSHNFLVELVFNVGVPGALLFLWFLYQWLSEGLLVLRRSQDKAVRRMAHCVIAFIVGQVVTGYLNGPSFMTGEFFLVAGVLAALAVRSAETQPAGRRVRHSERRPVWAMEPARALGRQAMG
ncbi:MAG TPA: O-antigen ligase family protein, partial [Bryobacteraceae bacterium]|nr:O-antigen ligase family protein [Bryobacteraceae bacterium]